MSGISYAVKLLLIGLVCFGGGLSTTGDTQTLFYAAAGGLWIIGGFILVWESVDPS